MNTGILRQPENCYALTSLATFSPSDIVVGKIIRLTANFFEVDLQTSIGILPVNELSIHDFDIYNAWRFVGRNVISEVKSITYNGQPILSRREIMLKTVSHLTVGDIIHCATVTSICNFAVFLDIGNGVTAILHMSDFSTSIYSSFASFVNVGDMFKVQILSIEEEYFNFKLSVSRKSLFPSLKEDPSKLLIGDVVQVRISKRVNSEGYFCEITPAISGIIDSSYYLQEGEIVSARICKIIPKGVRLNHVF